MHSSLALTLEGFPLGFTAKKFWNRDKFKGSKSLYRKKNATRIPIEEKESYRWIEGVKKSNSLLAQPERLIHIGDREADIYELFQAASSDKSSFIVRFKVNRRTADEVTTMEDVLKSASVKGHHRVSYRDKEGHEINAELEVKYETITIRPSYGIKSKIYPDITVTVIHATEVSKPGSGREAIDWKLMTNIPVKTIRDAAQKLEWYAFRWKIEVYFKVLKSGCKVEESKLRTAESLCKLIAVYAVLSWRVFWMTMIKRSSEKPPPKLVLTELELKILDVVKPDKIKTKKKCLDDYILKIAKLGGYLARRSDSPPGNIVMWRGLSRLSEIQIGVEIGLEFCG